MPTRPTYASFLVRLWREGDPERGTLAAGWQGEVQHIQTGQWWTFTTLEELFGFLHQVTEEGEPG